jgi:hypothetical protein
MHTNVTIGASLGCATSSHQKGSYHYACALKYDWPQCRARHCDIPPVKWPDDLGDIKKQKAPSSSSSSSSVSSRKRPKLSMKRGQANDVKSVDVEDPSILRTRAHLSKKKRVDTHSNKKDQNDSSNISGNSDDVQIIEMPQSGRAPLVGEGVSAAATREGITVVTKRHESHHMGDKQSDDNMLLIQHVDVAMSLMESQPGLPFNTDAANYVNTVNVSVVCVPAAAGTYGTITKAHQSSLPSILSSSQPSSLLCSSDQIELEHKQLLASSDLSKNGDNVMISKHSSNAANKMGAGSVLHNNSDTKDHNNGITTAAPSSTTLASSLIVNQGEHFMESLAHSNPSVGTLTNAMIQIGGVSHTRDHTPASGCHSIGSATGTNVVALQRDTMNTHVSSVSSATVAIPSSSPLSSSLTSSSDRRRANTSSLTHLPKRHSSTPSSSTTSTLSTSVSSSTPSSSTSLTEIVVVSDDDDNDVITVLPPPKRSSRKRSRLIHQIARSPASPTLAPTDPPIVAVAAAPAVIAIVNIGNHSNAMNDDQNDNYGSYDVKMTSSWRLNKPRVASAINRNRHLGHGHGNDHELSGDALLSEDPSHTSAVRHATNRSSHRHDNDKNNNNVRLANSEPLVSLLAPFSLPPLLSLSSNVSAEFRNLPSHTANVIPPLSSKLSLSSEDESVMKAR